ncbi:phosphotransferase [Schaalia georgiae]|uniref:phosphotransferase n=1 Tax=Schaalia georgiae TaxID=52768 RepID=UPI0003FC0C28|nr:phosphotransferase [Schaalia georgiae]
MTPLKLAALATVAVPGLQVTGLRADSYSDEVRSVANIVDASGNRWTVTCSNETIAGPAAEAEAAILQRLATTHDVSRIPFDVPRIKGTTRTRDGNRVYVHQDLGGRPLEDSDLADDPLLPASLGRALAALHNLPERVYTDVSVPSHSAIECRASLLSMLDETPARAAVPVNLRMRWQGALDDLSLWRFPPAPIHGDLQGNAVYVSRGSVVGIAGFTSACVGDPAVDIAWVQAVASDAFLEKFREAYSREREATDLHLFTRAQLMSELALVRWLLHGAHTDDPSVVEEARAMLADLSSDLGELRLVESRPHSSADDLLSDTPIASATPRRAPEHEEQTGAGHRGTGHEEQTGAGHRGTGHEEQQAGAGHRGARGDQSPARAGDRPGRRRANRDGADRAPEPRRTRIAAPPAPAERRRAGSPAHAARPGEAEERTPPMPSRLARRLQRGEADPHAATERLTLGPDGQPRR